MRMIGFIRVRNITETVAMQAPLIRGDALQIIEETELEESKKENEKVEILQARKKAFVERDTFQYYPPWRK